MAQFLTAVNPGIFIWLILMIVFIVGEFISVGLTSIWFAAGAFIALIVALFGGNIPLQILFFVIVSIALLCLTRPLAKKYLDSRLQKTNADAIIGQDIVISEKVDNLKQTGTANVRGQDWMVRSVNNEEIFEEGRQVRVVAISGVKLLVEGVKEDKIG